MIIENMPIGHELPNVWVVPLLAMTPEQWSYFAKYDKEDWGSLEADCNEELPFELMTSSNQRRIRPLLSMLDLRPYLGVENIQKYSIQRVFQYSNDF